MKTAFICDTPDNVARVFPGAGLEELGLCPEVYTKADVLACPERFAGVEGVFSTWGMPRFTEEEIRVCLPSLKAVFYGAGTVQSFARPFLNRGVRIFSAWAANGVPVAEYTVAQILLANKGFFSAARLAKTEGREAARKEHVCYPGNFDQKVGLIGVGMIGSMVARMLGAYRLEVLAFDPFLPEARAKELGIRLCSLEEVFRECSVVSNHLANNAQTRGMLGGSLFACMRPYATFINTGRGAQVVEEELVRILRQRPDLTALLDVTDPEPPVQGHPFYELPNCVLTPHIAGSSGFETLRMGEYMLEEYSNYIQGKPCKYEVTEKMLETMA